MPTKYRSSLAKINKCIGVDRKDVVETLIQY